MMVNRGYGIGEAELEVVFTSPSSPPCYCFALLPHPPVFQADLPPLHCLTSTKLFARGKAVRVRH